MYRFGFGAIFAGAGYVLSTGDVYNGSGITTGPFEYYHTDILLTNWILSPYIYSLVPDISIPPAAKVGQAATKPHLADAFWCCPRIVGIVWVRIFCAPR